MKSYYDILGVSIEANQEDIAKAYEELKFMYSKGVVSAEILYEGNEKEVLEEIENAYIVLSNPVSRAEYNRTHNIKPKRTLAKYSFDTADIVDDNIVEIPEFAKFKSNEYEEKLNKINKKRLSPQGLEVPKYVKSEEIEKKIQEEQEFRGDFFRFVREYKNMSYEFVSSRLKLSIQYIKYLETENFDMLPALVYIKGFIKSYAKLLDLPLDIAVSKYIGRYGKEKHIRI